MDGRLSGDISIRSEPCTRTLCFSLPPSTLLFFFPLSFCLQATGHHHHDLGSATVAVAVGHVPCADAGQPHHDAHHPICHVGCSCTATSQDKSFSIGLFPACGGSSCPFSIRSASERSECIRLGALGFGMPQAQGPKGTVAQPNRICADDLYLHTRVRRPLGRTCLWFTLSVARRAALGRQQITGYEAVRIPLRLQSRGVAAVRWADSFGEVSPTVVCQRPPPPSQLVRAYQRTYISVRMAG
ncbi:uncharacterized protein B0H18DRAFT_976271 [Fomitopsis serialis]|uniref:uncharacterized protein n=1 Tax=Fomitopsis serialis TaxID=139415 RepID=UPI0020075F56|nr:uncharacterized protein B0H18DRAFT_976271 [Neoantrodia serialis]KAH9935562.1 hypothetical protein B0H18DRAFT_976271 [Neoantrodia serialis]